MPNIFGYFKLRITYIVIVRQLLRHIGYVHPPAPVSLVPHLY